MPGPQHIIDNALQRIARDPLLGALPSAAQDRLRQILGEAVASENEACMVTLWNATQGKEREAMTSRFAEVGHLAHVGPDGSPLQANLHTEFWTRWYPGLETDQLTVGEVLNTLPGFAADDVPAIVRAFENPVSPLKLPGACTLEQHDVLHVLLGRGLVDQDEAFVLGFTAVSDPGFSEQDMEKYKLAFSLYPEPYCIRGCDLLAFDLGVESARRMHVKNLVDLDVTAVRLLTIGHVRDELGIDKQTLYEMFARERQLIPDTPWSYRLPTKTGLSSC